MSWVPAACVGLQTKLNTERTPTDMSAADMDVDARLNMVDLPAKQDLVLFVSMVESKLFHLRNG